MLWYPNVFQKSLSLVSRAERHQVIVEADQHIPNLHQVCGMPKTDQLT